LNKVKALMYEMNVCNFLYFLLIPLCILGCIREQEEAPKLVTEKVIRNEINSSEAWNSPQLKENKKMIEDGCWGLSIYEPDTGVIEYYTGKGQFLGTRSI